MGSLYTVVNANHRENGAIEIHPEWNDYAFLHSSSFKKIFGKRKYDTGAYSGHLKLKCGKKSIYLRYYQLSNVKGDEVVLSYQNQRLLGLINPPGFHQVEISKTNWFCYHWNNSNIDNRWSFRVAAISFLALFIIDIPQFIYFISDIFK